MVLILFYFLKRIFVAVWVCFEWIFYVRFWKTMFFFNMLYNIITRFFATFTHVFHTQYDISHYTYPSNLILKIVAFDGSLEGIFMLTLPIQARINVYYYWIIPIIILFSFHSVVWKYQANLLKLVVKFL